MIDITDVDDLEGTMRERFKAGKQILAIGFDGERSILVQLTAIDDDGNKTFDVLGRSPLVFGLN